MANAPEVKGNYVSFQSNLGQWRTDNKVPPYISGMRLLDLIPGGVGGGENDGSIAITAGQLRGVIIHVGDNNYAGNLHTLKFWKADPGTTYGNETRVDIGITIAANATGFFYSDPTLNSGGRSFSVGQKIGLLWEKVGPGQQFQGIKKLSIMACIEYNPDND